MLAALSGPYAIGGPTPGAVAQLVERLLCKEKVRSSNLLGSTALPVGVSLDVRRREDALPRRGGHTAYNQLPNDCALEPGHVRVPRASSSER